MEPIDTVINNFVRPQAQNLNLETVNEEDDNYNYYIVNEKFIRVSKDSSSN